MKAPDFSAWLDREPYSLGAQEKSAWLTFALGELTRWHQTACPEYAAVLGVQGIDVEYLHQPEDIPYLPVRLFKEFDLLSIPPEQVFKTMTSSGTTGQQVSKIYLDRETASLQTKVLSRLMRQVLGKKRLPMLIIDSSTVLKDRLAFSARGAGILGFSLFGQDVTYALTESMELDRPTIEAFLQRHQGNPIFIFGFTFIIWQYFVLPLRRLGQSLPFNGGILLHGGVEEAPGTGR
jgi:phenylacetate-coenzyme A ligase PaaK-like adenylate-forming protein